MGKFWSAYMLSLNCLCCFFQDFFGIDRFYICKVTQFVKLVIQYPTGFHHSIPVIQLLNIIMPKMKTDDLKSSKTKTN